jgi:excinuclease ABC subunit C
VEELQEVPGIGPAVAAAVVARLQGAEPGPAVNLSTGEVLD